MNADSFCILHKFEQSLISKSGRMILKQKIKKIKLGMNIFRCLTYLSLQKMYKVPFRKYMQVSIV